MKRPSAIATALDRPETKQDAVDEVFDAVAQRYDLGNDLMSLGWHTRWKRRLLDGLDLPPGTQVLDLATGTGDLAWDIAERLEDGLVVASDINKAMLAVARRKQRPTRSPVTFEVADAMALPYDDASFDLVVCGYAGRGFPSWPVVAAEVHRVLRPGGVFWNLDFARPHPPWWDGVVRAWMTASGGLLGLVLHGHAATYTYIPQTLARYPGQRWLTTELERVGFRVVMTETTGALMAYHKAEKAS